MKNIKNLKWSCRTIFRYIKYEWNVEKYIQKSVSRVKKLSKIVKILKQERSVLN